VTHILIFDVENLGQASTGKNSGTAPRSAVGVGADPTQWGHRSQSDESFTNADKQFGRFDTRDEYEAQMLPERIRLIHDVLSKNDRKLIVCYGKASRRDFERIFEDAKWRDAGKDRVADFNGARIVLTITLVRADSLLKVCKSLLKPHLHLPPRRAQLRPAPRPHGTCARLAQQ
jgi:hypothetical protein